MLRPHEGNTTSVDLVKCLKQIKYQRLLPALATISESPSNIKKKKTLLNLFTSNQITLI